MEGRRNLMIRHLKHFGILVVTMVTLLTPVLYGTAAAAAAVLYISPSTSSVNVGATLTVSIRENSYSEPVNAVQANISYPSNLLQFENIGNSSAFGIVAQNSGGGGSVQIARGALPSVSGDQLVATVQFKALAGSGTAQLSFVGGSSVVSANSNTNIMTSSPGGDYTLATPPPTSASSSHSSHTSAPPPPPKSTTPPSLSGIAVSKVTTGSATITWTTSEAATSEIDYGLATGYGLSAVDGNDVTAHTMVLNSPLIVPGTTYHFIVKATDTNGNTAASTDYHFTTLGAKVVVTVLDAHTNKPLAGATITFDGQTATTDSAGQATLDNLPIGTTIGTVTIDGQQTIETIRVTAVNPNGTPLNVSFKLTAQHTVPQWLITGLVLAAIVVAWVAGFLAGSTQLFGGLTARVTRLFSRPSRSLPPEPPTVVAPSDPTSTLASVPGDPLDRMRQ